MVILNVMYPCIRQIGISSTTACQCILDKIIIWLMVSLIKYDPFLLEIASRTLFLMYTPISLQANSIAENRVLLGSARLMSSNIFLKLSCFNDSYLINNKLLRQAKSQVYLFFNKMFKCLSGVYPYFPIDAETIPIFNC